jgi:multicomponent Na+:H+ antiporter subunit B
VKRAVEIVVLLLVAVFLAVSLAGTHGGGSPLRDYFVEHGTEETGALNLVTAIYLGYRAYDTLGETIVLLLAVSGVMVFVERKP